MRRLAIVVFLAVLALGPLGVSSATSPPLAGGLDRSFGRGGVVKDSGGPIRGVAVQSDGKIVVAAGGSLARYRSDGSLDSSFGDGGYVATGIATDALALEPDGKIVAAGASGSVSDSVTSAFAIARYNQDGSPDSSFGTNGITRTVIPEPPPQCGGTSGANAYALAILPGGDIVAAGSVEIVDCYFPESSEWALVRYTSDGLPDSAFGEAGIVQTRFFGQDLLSGIAVQSDGKLVATGSGGIFGHGGTDIATIGLARYEPDGSLDPTFGSDGKVTTNPKLFYDGGPAVLQHGRILVAGATSKNGNTKPWFPLLARYKANGRVDAAFGQHGFAEIRRQLGTPVAMLAQNDGKILIVEQPSTLVRLLPNGRLDTSFGRGGIVSLGGQLSTLALQADRKIVVGGASSDVGTLARVFGGNNCVVPDLRGKRASKARATLEKSHCRRGHVSLRFSSKVTRGRVISTAPPRGARLPGGTRIDLVISRGRLP